MNTVIGLFDTYEQADKAVKALQDAGFLDQGTSILARDGVIDKEALDSGGQNADRAAKGAAGGSLVGGLAGLLVGLGLLTIPGLGPVLAGGALATALASTAAGAGIGAAAGGIIGALSDMGVPKEQAELYAEGVKRGGVLVMVSAENERVDTAKTILNNAGAVDINARRAQLIEEGWTNFNEKSIPQEFFRER